MRIPSLKTADEQARLRESGRRLALVLEHILAAVQPGMTTGDIDALAEQEILRQGGIPIFKGYGAQWGKPFPAAVCVSLNDEVVHGIPRSNRVLREGDLLKVDIGLRFEGMVTDMARTVGVGTISPEAEHLLMVTQESLNRGIACIRNGTKLSQYSKAVQHSVESEGCSVVRDLVGHGVGHELHEDPQVPNYFLSGMKDWTFHTGMALALEPMVNAGKYTVRIAKDGWTFVTVDGSLSAHFEDTILVTEQGVEIVTRPRGSGVTKDKTK